MKIRKLAVAAALCLAVGSAAVNAQQGLPVAGMDYLVVGTVRSIDASTRTLTVEHQAIEGLNMGAMTMPFRLADGIALPDVKPGEGVAFILTRSAQGLAVTSLKKTGQSAADTGGTPSGMQNGMPGMQHGMGDRSMMAMMERCQQMMNPK